MIPEVRVSLILLVPVTALLVAAVVSHYRDLAWRVQQLEDELAEVLTPNAPDRRGEPPPRLAAVPTPARRVDVDLVDGVRLELRTREARRGFR